MPLIPPFTTRFYLSGLLVSFFVSTSPVVLADEVFSTDVIVSASLAVGQDAANGENFSFDTFRLKENNLRIHFWDTSSIGSFASNDWRLTANDNYNGGDNYFSIDDATGGKKIFRVDAGAPTDALRVSSRGLVGFGVAQPLTELHVKDGDTPTLRLDQDSTSGFGPQVWDVGGNETGFFIRNGSSDSESKLPFRISANAHGDMIAIKGNKIGLGTQFPKARLHINASPADNVLIAPASFTGDVSNTLHVEGTAFISEDFEIGRNVLIAPADFTGDVSNTLHVEGSAFISEDFEIGRNVLIAPADFTGDVSNTLHVEGTAFISENLEIGSSRAIKQDIRSLQSEEAMEAFKALVPVEYKYIKGDEVQLGFIAEDVPDLVATNSRRSLAPMDILAVLTRVVQAQENQIQSQQHDLEVLKNSLDELEAQLK